MQVAGEHEPTPRKILEHSKAELDQLLLQYHIEKPLLMIDAASEQVHSMLNDFPSNAGISTTLLEINIIDKISNLEYKIFSLKLGAYVPLYEGKKTHSTSGW